MCGIAGFVGRPDRQLLEAMSECIAHRGPDDEGYLERERASLSHRRLAVMDPEHGHQPMSNPENTLHIVYNGEVHNFRELRRELEEAGYAFSTSCDTEVVLRAYEEWGTACFRRFNGMWALAILDERPASGPVMVLSRDHLGVKPLYLAEADNRLLFASEIKALLAAPGLVPAIDDERFALYLLSGLHNHDEGTFFAGVRQLPPATTLVLRPGETGTTSQAERYWQPRLSNDGVADPKVLRQLLQRAVERRLIADVTVGTCLSGGLDSSTIVSLMSQLLSAGLPDASSMGERLKTFSAVFDNDPIDERSYIEPVLEMTKAESHYIRPTSTELFTELPRLVWHQDEPIVSSGPYAQYRVMAFAKDHARVLLDGQGGDELLAGYVPHQLVYIRELVDKHRYLEAGREAAKAADVLLPLVRRRLSDRRHRLVPSAYCRPAVTRYAEAARRSDRRTNRDLKARLLQDLTVYSLPPMLRNEDRNAMAHAIESRPPFLDQELVAYILSLPSEAIVHDGWSRAILRQAMGGDLPPVVRRRRKKIGFTTPEMRWFKRERAAVRGILRSPAFAARPFWDGPKVAAAFEECCNGLLEESLFFWRVLNAEAWLRVFHGPCALSRLGRAPTGSLEEAGDALVAGLVGPNLAAQAARLLEVAPRQQRRHLFLADRRGHGVYGRVALPGEALATREGGRQLEACLPEGIALQAGDVIVAAERQGSAEALSSVLSEQAGADIGVAFVRPGLDTEVVDVGGTQIERGELAWLLGDDPLVGRASQALLVRRIGTLASSELPAVQSPVDSRHQIPTSA